MKWDLQEDTAFLFIMPVQWCLKTKRLLPSFPAEFSIRAVLGKLHPPQALAVIQVQPHP